jgi:SHS2 domain-containing protein
MTTNRTTRPTSTNSESEESESSETRWKFLEHTADVRMEVYGSTLEELFLNASKGFMSLLASDAHIVAAAHFEVDLEASDSEELLVNWLRELLYQHETGGFVLCEAHISEIGPGKLRAKLEGGTRSPDDDRDVEVKGVTYHGISVEETDSGYAARVVFDI